MNYVKQKRSRPRLERRNANKNIDYDASNSLSSTSSSFDDSPSLHRRLESLEQFSERTSFRVEGIEGEFDLICRSLGLSGPEDFSIPLAVWEASKASSPNFRSSRFRDNFGVGNTVDKDQESDSFAARVTVREQDGDEFQRAKDYAELTTDVIVEFDGNEVHQVIGFRPPKLDPPPDKDQESDSFAARVTVREQDGDEFQRANDYAESRTDVNVVEFDGNEVHQVIGFRPPKLAPPPVVSRRPVDYTSSTWDILRDFGPPVNEDSNDSSSSREGNGMLMGQHDVAEVESNRAGVSESCSDSSSDEDYINDNNSPKMYSVSPNVTSRRTINSWQKGDFLGSGSFGTVYEGFTDGGFFFAVKEVSLLDQGSQGRESIYQLEREISLLSQFQHKNIVRYLGTEKDDSKLYIFLELVTKGSLSSLYQKYNLQDSQVSSYTRQILTGLNYLHQRNVVHRDIKCANILVHASGSVKLSDFGLAKATGLNDIKSCKGTAFWMAPEVVNGKSRGYGRAADIWSLGCTVLEMLTGRIPYSHLEGMQALFRIGKGEPPPIPSSLSREAQDFLLKCLQVNPDARPTATQLLDHPFVKKSSLTVPIALSPRS